MGGRKVRYFLVRINGEVNEMCCVCGRKIKRVTSRYISLFFLLLIDALELENKQKDRMEGRKRSKKGQ